MQFATEQGRKLLRNLARPLNRAAHNPGVNEVHDLRVAIRRFLQALAVLKPCFPRAESRRIRRGLRRIMVQAGSVRDHDIALRLLERIAVPESGELTRQFHIAREDGAKTLAATLQRWNQRNLAGAWRKELGASRPRKSDEARFCAAPVKSLATRVLPKMAAEHFLHGKEAVREDAPVREIHAFRIAAKNLRYTLELFAPLYGTSLAAATGQLREMQALLGGINDCAVVRRMVSRQQSGARKAVLSALKKRQRAKVERFRTQYRDEFSTSGTLRLWKAAFRRGLTGKRRPS